MKGADLSTLRNKYLGAGAYIVGRGPSLRRLRAAHFTHRDWPILSINAAAATVTILDPPNDKYLIQQDGGPHDKYANEQMTPVIHYMQEKLFLRHPHRIIYDPGQWRMGLATSSAEIAVKIVKLIGCNFISFLCFDAAVNGDGPELYIKLGKKIKKTAQGIPACWSLPE